MPEETPQAVETPVENAPVENDPVETTEVAETSVEEVAPEPEPVASHDIIEEEPAINRLEPVDEPEQVEVEPEAPIEQAAEFTNNQFALASALGMSVEDVKSFGTPDAFDRVIGGLANRAVSARQAQAQQQQQAGVAGQAQQQPELVQDFTFEEPDDYDDGVLKQNENTNKRFQQLEQHMNGLVQQNHALIQQNQSVQQEVASRELDVIFNTMDEQVFGRGRLNDVPEDLGGNRIQVANEAARLGKVHLQGGEQPPSLSQLAQRAANSLFSEKFTQNALEEASRQSRKIAGQGSAVPTRQRDVSDRGYEAAVRAAANWQSENGASDDYSSAFPG